MLTLLVWAALAGLLWKFGKGVIAERIGGVMEKPGERSAWIALLRVAGAALFQLLGLR